MVQDSPKIDASSGSYNAIQRSVFILCIVIFNEKLAAVESENAEMKAEMEVLKRAVATTQEKENSGVRTVALQQ